MDYAHVELIRASITALRALNPLTNPAGECVRLDLIERLTRSLDGVQFEFSRNGRVKQKEMF